jgi:hypothetical protein
MEQSSNKEKSKIAIIAFTVWIISFITFLIIFTNILLPFFSSNPSIIKIFSNLSTNKNFSLLSSLFLLTSIVSLMLSFIARKEIRLYRKSGRRLAKFTYRSAYIEIILFLILLIIYFIK